MGVFSKTETGRVVVQDGGRGSSEDRGWKARRASAEIKDIFASGHDVSFLIGIYQNSSRRAVPVGLAFRSEFLYVGVRSHQTL